jgi:hypothetical protein
MGATLWHHEVPWQADVAAALRTLQAEQFRRRYDFRSELEKWRRDAEQALQAERDSGDRHGLAEVYSEQLDTIGAIASAAPQGAEEQMEALRRVLPDGYGSVLDVTGVDPNGGPHLLRPLTAQEVAGLFGTDRPTLEAIRTSLHVLSDRIGRGESVAFAAYDGGKPAHWVFVGCTVD